jgi:hypothetical protein
MIGLRLIFYVFYIAFGVAIAIRLIPFGIRTETVGGFVLAAALIGLGLYRLQLYARMRGSDG